MKKWILRLAVCVGVILVGVAAWLLIRHLKGTEQDAEIKYEFYKADNEELSNPEDVGVMIMDCDQTSCLSIAGGVPTETKGKYVQGEGAIEVFSLMDGEPMQVTYKGVDISAYKKGSIHVSLYVGFPEYLEYSPITFELTSSGECDNGELSWKVSGSFLKPGWNELYLGIEDAVLTGEPDLTSLNYFRISTENAEIGFSAIVDSIYATNTEGMALRYETENM